MAGTFAEVLPDAPNASAGGTTRRRVPPTFMPGKPSLQKGSVVGSESVSEFSAWFEPRVVMICLPVESQTVNWTFTLPCLATAPHPTLISAYCNPTSPA